ncbi:Carbohydrate-binding CenC domain protein [Chthoniobacter flavus Ellin428]|uniref:Carbohydrate-binding CenC domain protein n=1 Tax=Chthoniobacter flavus Ellin428 TaxID=497964 RepID=B4D794_9BACT|nr:hypothetical protein [Chthoniobacter flavus]EDY17745.1 Carbohydrate-binding CenC domain protein [Chthoniobacter flavus Ellin428]TCO87070.1 hypothetical protein EV701_12447 [Chthoniobacter flavus]
MAYSFAARWFISSTSLLLSATLGFSADVPGNLIVNGSFEAGMQIWKGDGKIVLLPEGNRVCEIEASKSRMKDIKQEFHMKQLQQVEVIFRARSLNYTGPGLRVSIHQTGSGSLIWNKQLPEDGSWREFHILYTRAGGNVDARELNIATLIGTGKVQVDDVEVREPSKVVENQPPQPVAPSPAATPMPETRPPASAPFARPAAPPPSAIPTSPLPAGTFGSLADVLKSVPPDSLKKLQDASTVEAGITEINQYLAQNAKGKPAQFRVKIAVAEPVAEKRNKFRVRMVDASVANGTGDDINGRLWAYFPESSVPPDGKATVGSEIVISGVIGRCDINNKGHLQLNIDLQGSKLASP